MRKSDIRDLHKITVLNILNEKGPHRFNELRRTTNYVQSTLSSVLDELEREGKIEQIPHKGILAYAITKKGKDTILELGILGWNATQIMKEGGSYHDNYSFRFSMMSYIYELPWGIQDDITYEKSLKKVLPISEKTADEVHKFLYNCIKEDVKTGKIELDPTKDGRIILGFMIDYTNLVKSINEQSLYYLEHMSEKERELFDRVGDRTMTSMEKQELADLRKRGKVKLGLTLK